MNRSELFHRSVSVLTEAYRKNILKAGDCNSCAVGNLAAAGGALIPEGWSVAFLTTWDNGSYHQTSLKDPSYTNEAIKATGYTVDELKKIEWAFETAVPPTALDKLDNSDGAMLKRLLAVIDVLFELHCVETPDPAITEALEDIHSAREAYPFTPDRWPGHGYWTP